MQIRFCRRVSDRNDLAERGRCGSCNVQARSVGLRMIQYVGCVEAKLKTLGFGQLDRFTDIGVEAPSARSVDLTVSHRRKCARQSILKKKLTCLRIFN